VNSVTSFDSINTIKEKKILIRVNSTETGILIEYEDTGLGLSIAYKKNPKRILDPFETDKRNDRGEPVGTGMGMWIIAKTVSEYNGTIDLSKNTHSINGFHISIMLNSKTLYD
jgi:C4-dicarboxylate-specific signal transduction histidine kinase